ncbi:hypothetical protein Q0Z83_039030 [Actinoplanes sichuanensis]|uniref:DUF222 domain-containing protein n=1 Tax=Actinoplanes sichuanensis TaxID=512349 RepID=A0ABW4AUL3_9ACTN|nr:hypothetical protein [Actinoplanes sichuanensis]BEL05712.1 hypothetical protein Q0Z83_039030 [Actinoplanes sichuanensis]
MDPVRAILLALARRANDTHLYWQAGLAAVRARRQVPQRGEAFAHAIQAELCLADALRAADLPAGFRIDGITLRPDPVDAMRQLRAHVPRLNPSGPIEAEHEQARQTYQQLAVDPLTDQEQAFAVQLADLPVARRDKVVDAAERIACHLP